MQDLPEALDAVIRYAASGKDGKWPLPQEEAILKRINTYVALREGNGEVLRTVAGWNDTTRRYRVDPLPERVSDAWAHYLAGQDPTVTPVAEADATLMADLLAVNDFPSELERAAGLCVSEGEIWGRAWRDELAGPYPLLDWVSRLNVLPFWIGSRLAGAAIVTELPSSTKDRVYRHMEVHATGLVANVLFAGKESELGPRVELSDHPATDALVEVWQHNLPGMLVGRIPNRLRSDKRIGLSDYAGILDYFLDLNEAVTIGASNARLTARKRAVLSAAAAQAATGRRDDLSLTPEEGGTRNLPGPRFDPSEEVLVEDPLDRELGRSSDPLRILEYSFDAEPLIAYKIDLVESALSRVGLVPQFALGGGGKDGYAISGTALRLRLIPTDAAGKAKARYWHDGIPRMVSMLAQLDNLPLDMGGLNRRWADPVTPPTFTRRPGLPEDEVEQAQRHASLMAAGAESTYTAVKDLHPSWSEDEVNAEVDRIRADKAAQSASAGMFAGA